MGSCAVPDVRLREQGELRVSVISLVVAGWHRGVQGPAAELAQGHLAPAALLLLGHAGQAGSGHQARSPGHEDEG